MRKRKATQPKTPLKQTKISAFFTRDVATSKRFCPGKENSPKKVESPDIIVCTPPEKMVAKARKSLLGDLDKGKDGGVFCKGDVKGLTFEEVCITEKDRSTLCELSQKEIGTRTPVKNGGAAEDLEAINVICTPDIIFCTPPEKTSGNVRRSLVDYFVKKEDRYEDVKKNLFVKESKTDLPFDGSATPTEDCKRLFSLDDSLMRSPKKMGSSEIDSSTFDVFSSEQLSEKTAYESLNNGEVENACDIEMDGNFVDRSSSTLEAKKLHYEHDGGRESCFEEAKDETVAEREKNLDERNTEGLKSLGSSQTDSAFFDLPSSECLFGQANAEFPTKQNVTAANTAGNFANFDDFGLDDFPEGWSSQKSCLEDLEFDPSVVCEVISADVSSRGAKYEQILFVRDKNSDRKGRCVLRDMWALNINFSIGDTLTVFAHFHGGDWVVDTSRGYVCLFPEILVSSTSMVGAMFCRRRGVLSNYFKGIDSESKIMTIGSLVHEMLQKSLDVPSCGVADLENIMNDLLADKQILRSLYSTDMTMEQTKNELRYYIPFIINFLKVYVTCEEAPVGKNFKGVITKVVDIEENVSCLKLGIKGRIDVTVNVRINGKEKKMPLELKTGRASFSQEHRSQVFLYTIMMSSIGEKVESGLLLYLKEGILEEVKPSPVEIRDLILLRNDFAQYLRRFDVSSLPEPIHFLNACRKCPYSTVCSAFLSESIPEKHPIRSLGISFDANHLAYFQKWTQMLLLEDSYGSDDIDGLTLSGLSLEEGVVRLKNDFKYTFQRNDKSTSLQAGNFVVLIAQDVTYSGQILNITGNHCSILLKKELLNTKGPFELKGFKSSFLNKYLTNLGEFMEEGHHNLREIIINKQVAKINDAFPKSLLAKDCLKILGDLNEDQQRAVLKVLAAEDYILIEGPPGTGKTQTIVAMLRMFVALKLSVLLVGHTNSSVDNVLVRIPDIDFLRLGSLSRIHESVHSKSYAELCKNAKSVNDIETLLNRRVIASTCLGLDADIVRKVKFDVCIVDESSQVLQPEVLKPLFCSKKFVLIGDPKQLTPVVRNPMARKLGMDESIFERLYNHGNYVSLTTQYRMNIIIMGLANELTYNNKLKAGSELVEKRHMSLKSSNIDEDWLKIVFSTKIEDSVVFVDTANYLTVNQGQCFSCENPMEAKLTVKIVDTLINCGLDPEAIGVMSPFRAQVQKLCELMPQGIEVSTVDQYQGRDKDVIVFSCCKMDRYASEKSEYELLNNELRFNVAVTRAKCKLIFIGDRETLVKYKTFERFFLCLNSGNILPLEEGVLGFTWAPFVA